MQKQREFAIVDEVDSILIDEARTPLIYCTEAARLGIKPPGLGSPGSMAEYMLVDDPRHLVPLGELAPGDERLLDRRRPYSVSRDQDVFAQALAPAPSPS